MLTRTCNICGRVHKLGESCPKAKKRHKEYDEFRRDTIATGFYKSKAWVRMVSMIKERDHGLDQFELVINKKIVKGELVHHIVPLEDSPDRRLDPGNLIYVSRKSHRRIHDTYQKGEKEKEMLQEALFSAI